MKDIRTIVEFNNTLNGFNDDSIIDALSIQKRATEELYKICNDNEILKDSIRDLVAEIEQARSIIENVLEK